MTDIYLIRCILKLFSGRIHASLDCRIILSLFMRALMFARILYLAKVMISDGLGNPINQINLRSSDHIIRRMYCEINFCPLSHRYGSFNSIFHFVKSVRVPQNNSSMLAEICLIYTICDLYFLINLDAIITVIFVISIKLVTKIKIEVTYM